MKTFKEIITLTEGLSEVSPSNRDLMAQRKSHQSGNKIRIDSTIWELIKRKYVRPGVSITKMDIAIDKQRIDIESKTRSIIISPFGEYINVVVTPNNSNKSITKFYAVV